MKKYILLLVLGVLVFLGFLFYFRYSQNKAIEDASAVDTPAEISGNTESTELTDESDEKIEPLSNANSTINQAPDDMTDITAEEAEQIAFVPFGSFQNGAHNTAGDFTIVRENGKRQLVLHDNFSTEAGPDLYVVLSGTEDPATSQKLHASDEVNIGELQSISGVQTYDIPDSVDFNIQSVVVYCLAYKVIFGYANVSNN